MSSICSYIKQENNCIFVMSTASKLNINTLQHLNANEVVLGRELHKHL
jgi:hypothetical protein